MEEEPQLKTLKIVLKDCYASIAATEQTSDIFKLDDWALDAIFEKFDEDDDSDSLNDLADCRQVCKTWKRVATGHIQRKNWSTRNFLELDNSDAVIKYLDTISPSPDNVLFSCYKLNLNAVYKRKESSNDLYLYIHNEDMEKLFKILKKRIRSLFLTFDFDFVRNFEPRNLLDRLLQTQASSLTELKIHLDHNNCNLEPRSSRFKIEMPEQPQPQAQEHFELTNLTTLCFTVDLSDDLSLNKRLLSDEDSLMQRVFDKIPKNKPLKLSLVEWQEISAVIPTLERNDQIKNLKVLGISALRIGEFPALSLASSGVQLDFLALDILPRFRYNCFGNKLTLAKECFEFIAHQANFLQYLSLESPMELKFNFTAIMPKLKKLRLKISLRSVSDVGCECDKVSASGSGSESESDSGSVSGSGSVSDSVPDSGSDSDSGSVPVPVPDSASRSEPHSAAQIIEWVQNCAPILYKELFPKLEELELHVKGVYSHSQETFLERLIPPQSQCSSVRKLGIHYRQTNDQILKRISSTFPNITILHLGRCYYQEDEDRVVEEHLFESKYFTALWNADFAPRLLQLTVGIVADLTRQTYQLDNFFSGVPVADIRRITEDEDFEKYDPGRLYSSILNLSGLKKLIIYTLEKDRWEDFHCGFTDFSVFCTFGKMESLEYFHMDKEIQEFSKFALDHLEAKGSQCPRRRPGIPVISAEDRIHQVFGTGFNYNEYFVDSSQFCNLLDGTNYEQEYEDED